MGIEFGGREREERSIAGDEGERGKSKERAKGWSVGLILPPQSGAASDSICFKYMDRRVWAVAPTARDDTRREREKGSRGRGVGYDTRCILRENRPALLSRLPLQTGEDGDRRGMRRERERERGGTTPLYDTTRFPRYSLVSEANTPHPRLLDTVERISPPPPPPPLVPTSSLTSLRPDIGFPIS